MADVNDYNLAKAVKRAAMKTQLETAPPITTTAALTAIGNAINTTDKYEGKVVYNSTAKKLVIATGANANSVWNDAVGALAYTPV